MIGKNRLNEKKQKTLDFGLKNGVKKLEKKEVILLEKIVVLWYNKRVKKRCFMVKITIYTEFITLGQLLKLSNVINNGGEARFFLQNNVVLVCGEPENRRGRKLRPGDIVSVQEKNYIIVGI